MGADKNLIVGLEALVLCLTLVTEVPTSQACQLWSVGGSHVFWTREPSRKALANKGTEGGKDVCA